MLSERVPERVLAVADGERRLTDLRHVGELLHGAAMERAVRPDRADRRGCATGSPTPTSELGDEERSRRLESDAAAVQILTVHRSKGLEFPIVYLPYLWHPSPVSRRRRAGDVPRRRRRRRAQGRRRPRGPRVPAPPRRSIAEQRGEDLRLMYVALTRARHQAVVWWAGTRDSARLAAQPPGLRSAARTARWPTAGGQTPSDDAATERFAALAERAAGADLGRAATLGAPRPWSRRARARRATSTPRAFDRALDRVWRRTSYSDITAGAHEARVGSEPEHDVVDDEPAEPVAAPAAPAGRRSGRRAGGAVPARRPCPAATRVGTFVHDVLEATDFAAGDLEAELRRARAPRAGAAVGRDRATRRAVVAGLAAAIDTPLGPLLGGRRLRDVARARPPRRADLRAAAGRRRRGRPARSRRRRSPPSCVATRPPGDPLAGYAERLADPALRHAVRGYLTGSIDLVVRVPGPEIPRFAVVDYKSNWLAAAGEELTPLAPPARRAAGRDAAACTTCCRACSTPSRCTATCAGAWPATTPTATSRASSTSSCAAWPVPPRRSSTVCRAVSSRGGRPGALVADLSDLLDRGTP